MLRQDGERKNQAIKQAEKEKKALNRQLYELNGRYEQASAGLVQLTQEMANLKKQDSSEKARLKAQKEKLENLCRALRDENTKLKQSSSGDDKAGQATDAVSTDTAISLEKSADNVQTDAQPDAQPDSASSENTQPNSAAHHSEVVD